ncbi:palmitoyl-monogalactosyldiacylglycerol delta-7 desaturase, chloroplastic [alpha proteobacterium Q-1]|nr:palmitoyl-monogalactosyldiacylglycerol delta-7 desaturase, chloroplastic [alpha proteobacterium Q-1]
MKAYRTGHPPLIDGSAPKADIQWGSTIPFILAHLVCFAAIWTGVHLVDVMIALGLYALRMFGVTGGYHRYFSHRTFKTGRVFQFILAFIAQSSAQRGALWWASTHRHHHRHSDTDEDVHSPVKRSFIYSHMGWIFDRKHNETDLSTVPDLAKYPELRWLDRNRYLPPILLGFVVWLLAGWSGLVVGFFWSTVALWHATFFINSLAHVHGNQRYLTGDQSRNNWWLALLTFGEGWHNNHHYYQSAACQGFRWYEIDISFYILKGLAFIGVVHELKTPPEAVVKNEQRLGRAVVEKAAHQLAGSFHLDMISSELRQSLASGRASFDASMEDLSHKMDGLQKDINILLDQWQAQLDFKMEHARHEMGALVHNLHLPDLPDLPNGQQLRERALRMFAQTPSMNEILERARQIMIARVRDSLMHPHTGPVPASA